MKFGHDLKSAIEKDGGRLLRYDEHDAGEAWGGQALINADTPGNKIMVVFSHDLGWDHVSAHVRGPKGPCRTPSYTEMVRVKRVFFKDNETAMELHVPVDEHINTNPHVLHLWRPLDEPIPRPPAYLI